MGPNKESIAARGILHETHLLKQTQLIYMGKTSCKYNCKSVFLKV